MTQGNEFLRGRLLVVAFEGWNDAGEAATGAVQLLREQLDVVTLAEVDTEEYFDFQFNRPVVSMDDDGNRALVWPGATVYAPASTDVDNVPLAADAELRVGSDNTGNVFLLIGAEPSRNWKKFTVELLDVAMNAGITGVVLLGAMLADVPHTRPISVTATSENARVRAQLDIERSTDRKSVV